MLTKAILEASYEELASNIAEYLVSRGYADNGFSVTVSEQPSGRLDVSMTIFTTDAEGNDAEMLLTREFFPNEQRVWHNHFEIPYDHQNLGLSSVVTQHALDLYDQYGIRRIGLQANLQVGGYVWARYGFTPTPDSLKQLLGNKQWGAINPALADAPYEVQLAWFRENLKDIKDQLLGTGWNGTIDITDPEARAMMDEYLLRQASKSRAYKSIYPGRVEETRRQRKNLAAKMPSLYMTDRFREMLTRHQIQILRYGEGLSREIAELLEKTENDLVVKLRKSLERLVGRDLAESKNVARLDLLIKEIRDLRTVVMRDFLVERVQQELEDLAVQEAKWAEDGLNNVSPVELETLLPDPAKLRALVSARPFHGAILSEWAEKLAESDLARIRDQITIGLVAGENIESISRRIVGTAALNGSDGVLQITRNAARAVTRTAVSHYANEARKEVFQENSDIIQSEAYVATLDSHTTPICRALDGHRYAVGEGPYPPQHFQCRSIRVPVFNGEVLGNRPMKTVTDRQLLREYTDTNGLDRVKSRADLPRGHKRAYDLYARDRIRESTQIVSANVSYEQFLRNQPVWFQDDVLGKARGKLFREGGLSLDNFVDASGRQYTLAELRVLQQNTFRNAFGLRAQSPYDFLTPAQRAEISSRRTPRFMDDELRDTRLAEIDAMLDDSVQEGWEHAFVMDSRGRILSRVTDENANSVTFDLFDVRNRDVELHHSHPGPASFSGEDLMVAQQAVEEYGARSVSMWAHTPEGDHFRAVVKQRLPDEFAEAWLKAAYEAARRLMAEGLSAQDAASLSFHLVAQAAAENGIIEYDFELNPRFKRIMQMLNVRWGT